MSEPQVETTDTTAAVLTHVTFDEFLSLMTNERTTMIVQEYNRQVSYGEFGGIGEDAGFGDTCYVKNAIPVLEPTKNNLLVQILDQVALNSFTGTEQERIEAAAVESLNNFGLPTHVVHLTASVYGVFCLEDFKYKHIGPVQGAVICYRTAANIAFRVMD